MTEQLCSKCGGTILPPSQHGAERGTCACRREGWVKGRRFTNPAGPGVVWAYEVWWHGRRCAPTWAASGPAHAYLAALRSGTRQPEFSEEDPHARV